jgi:FkbM family methyltransferase
MTMTMEPSPMTTAPWWVSMSSSAIRTLPFGRYHLANALARFASRPFIARLPRDLGGAAFICDLSDTIAREVCFTGRYEPQETQIAQRLLRRGMTVVDVGANWGYFTLTCAHLVGAEGRVIALEPHPALTSTLASNLRANNLAHVEALAVAAGARAGTRGFVGFAAAGGNSGVSRAAAASERADFESATAGLDELLDARGVRRVDLVKIDIEGGEVDAIAGMVEGLGRHRYRFVVLECHPELIARAGSTLERCLEPLERSRYRGWRIDHSPAMHRRAAVAAVPFAELLSPIDAAALGGDAWPHLLWAAPGETLPA